MKCRAILHRSIGFCIPLFWIISKPHSFCFQEAGSIGKMVQHVFAELSFRDFVLDLFEVDISWAPQLGQVGSMTCLHNSCYMLLPIQLTRARPNILDVCWSQPAQQRCVLSLNVFWKMHTGQWSTQSEGLVLVKILMIHTVSPELRHIAQASNANCGSPAQMGSNARSSGVREERCFKLGKWGSKSIEYII